MAPADDVDARARTSPLWAKYGERIDPESARELLAARMEVPTPPPMEHVPAPKSDPRPDARRAPKPAPVGGGAIGDFLTSREGKRLRKQIVRGVFGMLKKRL